MTWGQFIEEWAGKDWETREWNADEIGVFQYDKLTYFLTHNTGYVWIDQLDNKFTVDIYDIKQEVVFHALGFNPLIGTTVTGTNLNSIASILHKFNNLQNVKNNIVFAACFRRSTDTQSITNTKYDLILYDFRLSDIKVLTMFEAKEISELKLLVENYLTEYISNKGE